MILAAACDVGAPIASRTGPVIVETVPANGDVDVPIDGPFIVRFDRRVVPRSVSRATVRVVSGNTAVLLSLRYDILTQQAVATLFDNAPLVADVDYRLIVEGVEDFDGGTISLTTIEFHTGSSLGSGAPSRATAEWDDVGPIFAARCATSGCHDSISVAARLDLSSAATTSSTLVGAVATTLPSGTVGPEGASGGPFFTGMRLVDIVGGAGRPETSYLTYTVLGDSHIFGNPMPPDSPLSDAEIETIVAWIEAGAPTPE